MRRKGQLTAIFVVMGLCVQIFGDGDELLHLEAALRVDPDLRGAMLTRVSIPPKPGEMGPSTEALQWISDNEQLLTALTAAVVAWMSMRRTKVRVKVDDREVEIDSIKISDPHLVASFLLREIENRPDDV